MMKNAIASLGTAAATVTASLVIPFASLSAAAHGADGGFDHPMYGDWGWGWGYMMVGPIMMIVFLGAIIALIVFAIRWMSGSGGSGGGDSALDILEQRFARGEIDKQEFEERRKTLLS